MILTTTLNLLKEKHACKEGYEKLIRSLGINYSKDKSINLLTILESNDLDDMLWCLRAVEQDISEVIKFAAIAAEKVLPIFEAKYPDDKRPRKAVELVLSGKYTVYDAANAAAYADAAAANATYAYAYAAANAANAAANADDAYAYAVGNKSDFIKEILTF